MLLKDELFIHYGHQEHAEGWKMGARPGTYVDDLRNGPLANTGAEAQNMYNLPRFKSPPDAYYIIRAPKGTHIQGPGKVMPAYGNDLEGFIESILVNGTPPGTVLGPFKIPYR